LFKKDDTFYYKAGAEIAKPIIVLEKDEVLKTQINQNMFPLEYHFWIQNYREDDINEVDFEYSIELENSTKNFPVSYDLFDCKTNQPIEFMKGKSEPLKIWGEVKNGKIIPATSPAITAQCVRVPVSDGHTAACFVKFENKPELNDILGAWAEFAGEPQKLNLPSAPKKFIHYFEEDNRPQPALDRNTENGMAVCAGRLREDNLFDYKFIGFSHNTLRGAAGGAVLLAELLASKGFFD